MAARGSLGTRPEASPARYIHHLNTVRLNTLAVWCREKALSLTSRLNEQQVRPVQANCNLFNLLFATMLLWFGTDLL